MGKRERQKQQRRQRWGQVAIGIFIALLMILSVIQFSNNGSSSNALTFNRKRFTLQQDGFRVKADGQQLLVQDLPIEGNVANATYQNLYGTYITVTADPAAIALLENASAFVLTFDPATEQPAIRSIDFIRYDLAQRLGKVYGAVLANSTAYPSLPVVGCDQTSTQMPVVQLLASNETTSSITLVDGCVTITGDAQALLAAKDHLLLSFVGVIPRG